jgi:hypothetical protein
MYNIYLIENYISENNVSESVLIPLIKMFSFLSNHCNYLFFFQKYKQVIV